MTQPEQEIGGYTYCETPTGCSGGGTQVTVDTVYRSDAAVTSLRVDDQQLAQIHADLQGIWAVLMVMAIFTVCQSVVAAMTWNAAQQEQRRMRQLIIGREKP